MVKFDSDQVPTRTVSAHRKCDHNGVLGRNVVESFFRGPLTTCVDLELDGYGKTLKIWKDHQKPEETWKGPAENDLLKNVLGKLIGG